MWGGLKSCFIAFQRHWNTVDWLTFKAPPLITRDIVVAKIASPGSIWVSKHLTREHLMAGMVLAGKGFWQGGEATLFHTCLLDIIICIFKISSLCMILSSPSFVITTFDTHTYRVPSAWGCPDWKDNSLEWANCKTRNVSATRNLLSFVDWRSYNICHRILISCICTCQFVIILS